MKDDPAPANPLLEVTFVGQDHVNALRDHVVCLLATGQASEAPHFFTGFMLQFNNLWLWCTAGHCIEKIAEYIDTGCCDFNFNSLADGLGLRTPINFSELRREFINDREVDFGFIVLSQFYVDSLIAAGVVPIASDTVKWDGDAQGPHILLGVPAESVSFGRKIELGQELNFTPMAILLTRTSDIVDDGLPCMTFSFEKDIYLVNQMELDSVAGMSGGPIFYWGADENGKYVYVPVGIQHAWTAPKGPLRATPMCFLSGVLPNIQLV